jgi:L-lactate dehydrogenase complex protein LldG
MSTVSKEAILSRVRGALNALPKRATLPDWDLELAQARKLVGDHPTAEMFAERIKLVNGRCYTSVAEVVEQLRAGGWTRGYCDPALLPVFAPLFGKDFTIETEFDRTRIDDYAFGITQARAAIAETGTIMLDDVGTSRRLAALAPWVHVAVVPKDKIYPFLADAVKELGVDPNLVFATGPSRTADVEGILIEGVHGPGQQWALLV